MIRSVSIFNRTNVINNSGKFIRRFIGQIEPQTINQNLKRGFFKIVDQEHLGYREFLGSNKVRMEPGFNINIPLIHKARIVDMRERTIGVQNVNAYTKDNVPVRVSGALFFKVKDADKALYAVSNYISSTENVGLSAIRSIIGRFEYDKITAERASINGVLRDDVNKEISEWGIMCTKFEIQNFAPDNSDVARQLELQMEAERKRRENELVTQAKIRTAEGDKQSAILQSEGLLIAAKNEADAKFILAKKKADGNKYSIDAETEALANQIETLTEKLGDEQEASKLVIEYNRIKNLGKIANNNNNTYFFPADSILPTARVFSDLLKPTKLFDPVEQQDTKPRKTHN